MAVTDFIKKHIIIKNRDIMVIMVIIFLYRMTFSIFTFSMSRFMVAALGPEYFLIGLANAVSNGIALCIDIPVGVAQKYIAPRYFILLSVTLLLISDLIFMMSTSVYWINFLAVLFYQLSVEIYFITIVTFVLRISSKKDAAQNLAQTDIVDNSGDITGTALAGVLFTLDRFVHAQNFVLVLFLLCCTLFMLIYAYEFADHKHHTSLENYILNLKLSRKVIGSASHLADELVADQPEAAAVATAEVATEAALAAVVVAEEAEPPPEKPLDFRELGQKISKSVGDTVRIFGSLLKNPLATPLLVWTMVIIVITTFWNESLSFFEPYFLKFLYHGEDSVITDSVSRYIFESAMLIAALVIPTFLFEYPLGVLADKWGKDKMIVLCTVFSGVGLTFLSLYSRTFTLFLIYVVLGISFVGIYPSMVGLLNEEYQKNAAANPDPALSPASTPALDAAEEEGDEGISAAIVSILMNIGQITAGLLGGFLLTALEFNIIFILLGFGLVVVGVGSWFFLAYYRKSEAPAKV